MNTTHAALGLILVAQVAGCRMQGDTIENKRAGQLNTLGPDAGTGIGVGSTAANGKLENVGGTAATAPEAGPAEPQAPGPALSLNPDLPVIVRGRWALSISAGGDSLALAGTSASAQLPTLYNVGAPDEVATQQMDGVVPTQVLFNVTNDGFTDAPTPVNGVVSYGYLTVAALYDNNDHVCGASGTVKCATAAIRLYTTVAPAAGQAPTANPTTGGAGLWNSALGVGLPILSGSGKVGFGAANALVVSVDQLTTKNVITLGDFTFAAGTQVPLAVDYTNAPADSYAATLVIEYVLQ